MPNTFKNYFYATTNAYANVYVAGAGVTAIVIGAQAANKSTTNTGVYVSINSNATSNSVLCNNIAIPVNASLGFITGKLVLEPGDYIQAYSTNTGDVHITLSVLEIT
jgi:hypothetical protein